jgi:glycosyltransferase involved in cell wall biosynthesis
MLTDLDGNPCGVLVAPKSADAIVEALEWLQSHKAEADKMCKKAYEKVYTCYRKEVVYDLYKNNYKKLL